MAASQLPVLPVPGPQAAAAQVSPEYVRISMASAVALRLRSGRFTRDFPFGGINLLLNYGEGCLSDCGYCGLARIYLTTHGGLVKNAIVVGDFNELPPAVVAMESALRWHRLDQRSVTEAVIRTGAGPALGITAERIAAAVLDAGRQAGERVTAAPVRSAGSCYFPESA